MKNNDLERGVINSTIRPTTAKIYVSGVDDDTNITSTNPKNRTQQWFSHVFVVLCCCCFAVGLGVATYFGVYAPEMAVFKAQFNSCVVQLQTTVEGSFVRKFAASRLLGNLYQSAVKYKYGTHFIPTISINRPLLNLNTSFHISFHTSMTRRDHIRSESTIFRPSGVQLYSNGTQDIGWYVR